ncbi:MFS transporter [Actinomadura sp. HBU206391]|uniref:MFS transporter n=1 Tax=Actinomadura sp. HBU206391 TaxID=2731692 RepID=UPI001650A355|nr:MFS transporter [Actinomadura sp. HBU206391]
MTPGHSAARSVAADGSLRFGSGAGRWVLLASVLGSGLAGIDATVVNVALPSIGAGLHVDFAALQWTITAYTLTLASLILLGGALGDRYGRRRVFVVGVAWFAVASVLCGLAPTAGWLIAARAVQGMGGALLLPGSLAMIQATFAAEHRARAIGAWSGFGAIAAAIGPFTGGWLIEVASWRWVFLINAPLALVVVLVAQRHVPETRGTTSAGRIDIVGATLGVLGLAGITYTIIAAPVHGLAATAPVGIAGAVCLAGFLLVEARSRHPMLPLSIFRSARFRSANAVTFAVYVAFGGVFFLLVVHLQIVAGFSPPAAGAALLPVTVVVLLLSARGGRLAERTGPRLPMTAGPLVCAAGLLLMLRIGEHAAYVGDVAPAVIVLGLGLALLVAPLTATVLAAVDARHAGLASGVNNAVAGVAGLLGVAALPALTGLSGAGHPDPTTFDSGFRISMLIASGLLLIGSVLAAVTIPTRAPNRVSAASRPCASRPAYGPSPPGTAPPADSRRSTRPRGADGSARAPPPRARPSP